MRIRSQLFIGVSILVLSLLAIQWWIHVRQLRILEEELSDVATSVGEALILGDVASAAGTGKSERTGFTMTQIDIEKIIEKALASRSEMTNSEAEAEKQARGDEFSDFDGEGEDADAFLSLDNEIKRDKNGKQAGAEKGRAPGSVSDEESKEANLVVMDKRTGSGNRVVLKRKVFMPHADEDFLSSLENLKELRNLEHLNKLEQWQNMKFIDLSSLDEEVEGALRSAQEALKEIELRVEAYEDGSEFTLVIDGAPGGVRKVPIPVERSVDSIQANMHQGFVAGGLLLVLGLTASGLLSHRLTRPLRELESGVAALGRGELGTTIEPTAGGEIGNVQAAFNQMSQRLAELEREKERWRNREHVAELGLLARALAHALRNPLNTLGLLIGELAALAGEKQADMVETAQNQLKRIDRRVRLFLSVGTSRAADTEITDLHDLVRDVMLETAQEGADIDFKEYDSPLHISAIPTALRSALGNLIVNAIEASGETVIIELAKEENEAVIKVVDKGPGLPENVRNNLFKPHVTTKINGSGMGLFLSRQIIESAHEGKLMLYSGATVGTVAEIRLPLAEEEAGSDESEDLL